MGSVAVQDLAASKVKEIIVCGRDAGKAEVFASKFENARGIVLDASSKHLETELKRLKPDVVVNASLYKFNLNVMKAAIAARVSYVDLGGLYHMTLKQLKLDAKARKAGVVCLLGMGSTPGTTNVMAGYAARGFDVIDRVEIRSGWRVLENTRKPVLPYTATTIIDEFVMPAIVLGNEKIRFVNPLDSKVVFEFQAPLGKVSGHYTIHSELATMPKQIGKGVREMDFAVAYPPEFTRLVESIIKRYKTKEQQVRALEQAVLVLDRDARDVDGQRVEIYGRARGKPARVSVDCITTFFGKWKRGSAIDTGIPPSIAAQWIANKKIKAKGVVAPETAFKGLEKQFFKELFKHSGGNIRVYEQVDNGSRKPLY